MERTADALPNANMFHISRTEHGIVAQFEVLFEMYESHSHTWGLTQVYICKARRLLAVYAWTTRGNPRMICVSTCSMLSIMQQ